MEVAPFGIGVSLVEPGDIRTPFNDNMDWGDPASPAYAERRGRAERVVRESLPKAPGPDLVAEVIHRALTARRPRARYTVGPDDWLTLALIRDHFKV
jgi:NAD(P)-dependent dehydrogenase (short-subunit alcohol dehydrogenase family)